MIFRGKYKAILFFADGPGLRGTLYLCKGEEVIGRVECGGGPVKTAPVRGQWVTGLFAMVARRVNFDLVEIEIAQVFHFTLPHFPSKCFSSRKKSHFPMGLKIFIKKPSVPL